MNFITTIVKRFLPKEISMPVGRWRIEQCNTKMNQKIDLSNEDHCGPCGQYALNQTKIQSNLAITFEDKSSPVIPRTPSLIRRSGVLIYKLPKDNVPPYMPRSGIVAK